ncbi:6-phospho-3-hexuloisomerase [Enterococcus sp. AD013-P3]|uniref:6-phospho-3-hexuloisomerase n=1 Tax=Enterococcus sp. AD013-P3 TaxID=3411036 RepID=UPI003B94171F
MKNQMMDTILAEVHQVIDQVEEPQLAAFVQLLQQDKRVFLLGEGRSGLQGKGFAMRLMHIGRKVYVIGETITPAIASEDILVAISGSGKTGQVLQLAQKAVDQGVTVVAVTSSTDSPLAQLTPHKVIIPGATKTGSGVASIQLLSSLFDQSLHFVLDYVTLDLSQKLNISNESAKAQHSNME